MLHANVNGPNLVSHWAIFMSKSKGGPSALMRWGIRRLVASNSPSWLEMSRIVARAVVDGLKPGCVRGPSNQHVEKPVRWINRNLIAVLVMAVHHCPARSTLFKETVPARYDPDTRIKCCFGGTLRGPLQLQVSSRALSTRRRCQGDFSRWHSAPARVQASSFSTTPPTVAGTDAAKRRVFCG